MTPDEVAYTTYTTFNTAETIDGKPNALGGFAPERVALRRAIGMGFRIDEKMAILDKGQSTRAQTPLPPAVSGHDPDFVSPTLEYNPAKAKALLDMFGYVDRDGDGYREAPDGSPFSFEHASTPTLRERQRNELWKKSMDAIGLRVTFDKVEKLPELRKQAQIGRVQSFSYGWIADFPDGENFLQLLYKGSIGQVNYAMFDHPEYNALYERVKRMPDSPGAQRPHRAHGEADRGVRAVARGDLQGAEDPGAALGAGLQEAPLRARAVEVPRHRPRAPPGALRPYHSAMAALSPDSPPRPASLFGTLVTAALVLVLAWLLAHWTWVFVAPPAVATAAPAAGAVDLAAVARLFGGAAPAGPSAPAGTSSGLRLKGVIAPSPANGGSAVFNAGGKDIAVILGGEVQPGVKLVAVEPDHVVVSRAGVRERIDLDVRMAAVPRAVAGQGERASGCRSPAPGPTTFTFSRKELDDALKDPGQLSYLGRIGVPPGGGVRLDEAPAGQPRLAAGPAARRRHQEGERPGRRLDRRPRPPVPAVRHHSPSSRPRSSAARPSVQLTYTINP